MGQEPIVHAVTVSGLAAVVVHHHRLPQVQPHGQDVPSLPMDAPVDMDDVEALSVPQDPPPIGDVPGQAFVGVVEIHIVRLVQRIGPGLHDHRVVAQPPLGLGELVGHPGLVLHVKDPHHLH